MLSINYWRASLVPAAAVIPAPIVYANIVAVKKLVVEFLREPILCGLNKLQKEYGLPYSMLIHRWNSFSDDELSFCFL